MKLSQKDKEIILDSEIDEFDMKQDEKSFNIRYHDDYSFKIVLED